MAKDNRNSVVVLAPRDDRWAERVFCRTDELMPQKVFRLDSEGLDRAPLRLDRHEMSWNGIRLERGMTVYLSGWCYENPVQPRASRRRDYSLWQCQHVIDQQRWSFIFSLLARLAAQGVRLVNPPSLYLDSFMKPLILDRLAAGGVKVPYRLCSNDHDQATGLLYEKNRLVWRTVSGSCAWQLFTRKQLEFLCRPEKPPIMMAEIAEGPLMRAWLVGGKPVLVLEQGAPCCLPEEQLEQFRKVDYPFKEMLGNAARLLGSDFCQIIFVAGADGPVVYDIDIDPAIEEMPEAIADYLAGCLAGYLLGIEAKPQLPSKLMYSRPVPFLRRMLNLQFEIQKHKYKDTSKEKAATS